ncbi:MAG: hypothetical protein COV34_02145 [Candidatus Zambryskibacteria bacterium CG10_big_fil_rev_8_21_14_0_10_42_12]|uniref:Methyltransferase domain-containing protein n=1 Tax=Candidatus Zambryskibacteria bacterium CG10_big_fil_rev_8_21_14_0_10_42_12 TaxID=1975115 RepID=A0A2H0QXM1_9BACT|nr:MAG: hypothetical protein COV34_02145 [Candidatus Zambryskibacteria bacterium CG10_big_fil_rev_8_21_14_0_10_42_12]
MAQEKVWDQEYTRGLFITGGNEPQADTRDFVKFLKKQNVPISGTHVLDLGSGTGRNSIYFAELGAHVSGIEISSVALREAEKQTKDKGLDITYLHKSMGENLPFKDNSFDIVLDVTSSNSLTEEERDIYIQETNRVLKPSGWFYIKALCKDGDKNAQNLLKSNLGKEKDTYTMPETNIIERVWSREYFEEFYGKYFKIVELQKKTNYSRFNNQSYKRNFWIAYSRNM